MQGNGFSAAEVIQIITAITGLMTVLGGAVLAILQISLKRQVEVVHQTVNSNASKQDAKLTAALEEVKALTQQLNNQQQVAAVLAEKTKQDGKKA